MNSDENHHHNRFFKTLDLVTEANRPVRIADILAGDDGEEELFDGGDDIGVTGMSGFFSRRRRFRPSASFQCASPRRIVGRCLAALRPARERRALFESHESDSVAVVREFAGVSAQASCSRTLPNSVDSPVLAPESDDSGRCRTDASFNLGVACGLLYLIGASKTELNKMVEVRKQMEMLLQNFTEELQNKNSPLAFKMIESKGMNNLAHSTSSDPQISVQMNSPWTTSYVVPESETILECDGDFSHCAVDKIEQRRVAGMDELEAELEAELELLEINLDTGHSSNLPQQRTHKIVVDTSSSSSASSLSSLSQSLSFGDIIIDALEMRTEEQREVSPIELERKLRELLEARQQERIHELEEALEYTKHKLREKELEVSWWQDTAKIISHHVPEKPQIVSQQNPKTLHFLR